MTNVVIDRRKNGGGKSTPNRQKYLKRVRDRVKQSIRKSIRDGRIGDVVSDDPKAKESRKVRVGRDQTNEPTFSHDPQSGRPNRVLPGNKEFVPGDVIPGGGGSGDASDSGEGEDVFEFYLTKEEFMDLFLEDLELPNLIKKQVSQTKEFERKRAGFVTEGNPARLNTLRTFKKSKSRRIGLRAGKKRKIRELEAELNQLDENQEVRRQQILDELETLRKKLKAIPFIDDVDLRYNNWTQHPVPCTQAVMFCVMDVSASMGEWEKEMAKRFFILLYLFLYRNYEVVRLVFIRHTHEAKEVDEDEFFYSKETGGTRVSSALTLMNQIINERFSPSEWNIFCCQASDGDNFTTDTKACIEMMESDLLPKIQYYAYVEIKTDPDRESDLMRHYEALEEQHENFSTSEVFHVSHIYPVFRKLFEKKND